jgi:o-succinylbenzoate synthase
MSAQPAAIRPLTATWLAVNVNPLQLQLHQPLLTAAGRFSQREVLLLEVTLRVGGQTLRGYGEASALPGWSPDSFVENLALAQQIQASLGEAPLSVALQQQQQFGAPAWQLAGLDQRFPSLQQQPVLRFGLELAVLDALARYQQLSLAQCLSQLIGELSAEPGQIEPLTSVPVQCTVGAEDHAHCKALLAAAVQAGFTHAKLKVGVAAVSDDLQRIQRLLAEFPQLTMRLDANAAWDVTQTISVCTALRDTRVELIEQPASDASFAELLQQAAHDGPLLAADESSLPAVRAAAWMQSGVLPALVLKPSVHGGLLTALALMQVAARHRVKVVLSNLLEAAVARSAIAQLAAACPQHDGPHGLATGDWFAADVVAASDRIHDGHLQLRRGPGIGLVPECLSR